MNSVRIKIEHFITSATASIVLLGAIYLKFFWDSFGVNAFHYAGLADIGLAASGQMLMLVYTVLVSGIGFAISSWMHQSGRLGQSQFTRIARAILFFVIFFALVCVSIKVTFPRGWGWLPEATVLVGLLSFVIVLSTLLQFRLENSEPEERREIQEIYRYWIVVLVLVVVSYVEAKEDANDILRRVKYSTFKKGNTNITYDSILYVGKMGEYHFLKPFASASVESNQIQIWKEDELLNGEPLILYKREP